MIRALSPYYINVPLRYGGGPTTCERFKLHIVVHDGNKATASSQEDDYVIDFANIEGDTDSQKINISPIVRDFITFRAIAPTTNTTQIISANDASEGDMFRWVYTYVTYDDDDTTKYEESTEIMGLGYSYGLQGENYEDVDGFTLLDTSIEYSANFDGTFIFPFQRGQVNDFPLKVYRNGNDLVENFTITASTDSEDLISYLWLDISSYGDSTEFLRINYYGEDTIVIPQRECRYNPLEIHFQNKDGAQQVFTFMKKRVSNMTVESKTYETNTGQPQDGYHQFQRYNVQGRKSVIVSSGFLREEENEVMQQLLLAEKVWCINENEPFRSYTPLNIKTTDITYKNRLNDKLVNYDISFDFGYNQVNNV